MSIFFSENRQGLNALESRFYRYLLRMKAVIRVKSRHCQLINVDDFTFLFSFNGYKQNFQKVTQPPPIHGGMLSVWLISMLKSSPSLPN